VPPVPSALTPVPLGDTGLALPRLALGCGNFGGVGSAPEFFGRGIAEPEAFAIMDAAWDLGLRHFDTADAYGGGRSEAAIGRWMRARGRRPLLTTKTFNPMEAGADHGLAPDRVRRQFVSGLERLGVDRVDVYLAHDVDPDVAFADTAEAFEELLAAGVIGAYGVSNFDAAQLEQALAAGRPRMVQNSLSLLDRGDEAEVLGLCAARGVGYAAFGPLAGGWLAGRYRRGEDYPPGSRMTQRPEPYRALGRDEVFDALEALGAIAEERGSSMAALALAWLLADPRVSVVVVGPGRPEHLAPVAEALARPLDARERERIGRLF
jgi:aryl-alcohol dehydrogenase-like predicted oxidoreductase